MWDRYQDKLYCPPCANYLKMTTPSFRMGYIELTSNEMNNLRGTLECDSQIRHNCERIG